MTSRLSFSPANISAAILAGGEGRRVDGHDKGLLLLAGKSLVAHVVGALSGQADAILICTNRDEREYAPFGRIVRDPTPGFRGPLAGIASALAQSATPWLLTVPVDGPNLPRDLATRLLAAAVAGQVDLAVAYDGARRQPLFALYRTSLAASAAEALQHDLPAWRWQQDLGAAHADFSDVPQAFVNLNTLDAFREWERVHGH